MFYSEYLKYRRLKDKIEKKLRQTLDVQNAAIKIRDLIVYPDQKKTSYGESKEHTNPYDDIDKVARLIDHIKSLSEIANLHHKKAYCEPLPKGKHRLKKEHYNNITRLCLSEFSLYGSKPLIFAEFSLIVDAIRELARQSPDNVHLLLSSFSVINEQGKNLNLTLYVQSGENPKIDIITKSTLSDVDVTYYGTFNYLQQKPDFAYRTSHVSAYVAGNNPAQSVVSNNSILEVETKGGAKYLQAVDVCLDHLNQHSKRLLMAQLDSKNFDTSNFIPEQVDQIVTANSIDLWDDAEISDSTLHVDPRAKIERWNKSLREVSILNSKEIESLSHYPKMNIVSTSEAIFVENPPFGSDFHVIAHGEVPVGKFNSTIDAKIKDLNKQIMRKKCADIIVSNKPQTAIDQFHAFEDANAQSYLDGLNLLNRLSKKCKPSFFEYIFGTKNYYLKKHALEIIEDSAITLNNAKEDAKSIIAPWTKDLHFRLDRLADLPDDFIEKMKKPVLELQQSTLPPNYAVNRIP